MHIVVLAGHALNPGDLSWEPLSSQGEWEYYDRTAPDQVVPRAIHADILFTNKVALTADVIAQLPNLNYIGLLSTGYNVVDLDAARARNIPVCNVPAYSTDSVAQMTFVLLLHVCNGVGAHAAWVADGGWARHPDFCHWLFPITELAGKTFGIVGYGAIGRAVGRLARAFGMQVLACNRSQVTGQDGVRIVDADTLLAERDIVSLHCPLYADNTHWINRDTLARMRDGAILINTARGGLVDELAVREALDTGKLAYYLADVLSQEPPSPDHVLTAHPRCVITPHAAWASRDARTRLLTIAADNLRVWLQGGRQNCVWQ